MRYLMFLLCYIYIMPWMTRIDAAARARKPSGINAPLSAQEIARANNYARSVVPRDLTTAEKAAAAEAKAKQPRKLSQDEFMTYHSYDPSTTHALKQYEQYFENPGLLVPPDPAAVAAFTTKQEQEDAKKDAKLRQYIDKFNSREARQERIVQRLASIHKDMDIGRNVSSKPTRRTDRTTTKKVKSRLGKPSLRTRSRSRSRSRARTRSRRMR
jgi:hypothetical protein